jgi:DNA-binding transcriptional MerR regulator
MKTSVLPPIPAKRYFTIGEVAELCAVKPHVLRYWEQEFTQLNPMKRRGNRRYYQHHEVLMVRRIRDLLYEQGFTISGARIQLENGKSRMAEQGQGAPDAVLADAAGLPDGSSSVEAPGQAPKTSDAAAANAIDWTILRQELEAIRIFLD